MKKLLKPLLVAGMAVGLLSANAQPAKKQEKDFGVVLNLDGDISFTSNDPVETTNLIRANIDLIHSLGIKTLTYSVASGSDVLNYPTKVGSTVGWRTTKYDENEFWRVRNEKARVCIAAGVDAINVAASQAKTHQGMLFIPSLRMNDSHYMRDPENYPLTGEFRLKNPDLIIKNGPWPFNKQMYGNLLDYTHEKVRKYRLDVIFEVIDRNKQYIDGFELDFNRVQVFFPEGKGEERAHLITDLVKKVREKLNQVAKEQGRPMYLFARIPPAEESCKVYGLDIDTWMKQGLVDMLSPAQLMTLAQDMPIENMITKANRYNVKVYPSVYARANVRAAFIPSAPTLGINRPIARSGTTEEAVGAVSNYFQMGAHGIYLYNHFRKEMHPFVAAVTNRDLDGLDKVFSITKTYYNDHLEPSYAYVKQLPYKTKAAVSAFNLYVGEIPSQSSFPLTKCLLRLGIRDLADGAVPKLTLNGKELTHFITEDHLKAAKGKRFLADAAHKSVVYKINDPTVLKLGNNKIEITVQNATITDLEIGYSYLNNLNYRLAGLPMPKLNEAFVMPVINEVDDIN